mgnify:CR=1 FL=1
MGPTRPRYIVAIIINLPQIFNVAVRLRVNPTVAVALIVSYKISIRGAFVTQDKSIVDTNIIPKDKLHTAIAFFTAF